MVSTKGIRLLAIPLFCLMLGACGGLAGNTRPDDGELIAEKIPNPYWEQNPRIEDSVEQQFEKALNALEAGELQSAQTGFEQLTLSHPKLSGPWVNLGIVHYQLGDLESAELAWLSALEMNDLNSDAYAHLGRLYREQGRFEQAESIYTQALASWPDNAEVHCNLGILYDLYTGQQILALNHYQICEELMDEPPRQLRGWIVDLERRAQAQSVVQN